MREREIKMAFPRAFAESPGMSLRDYFAGKALVGILSSKSVWSASVSAGIAKRAYEIADDMLDRGAGRHP